MGVNGSRGIMLKYLHRRSVFHNDEVQPLLSTALKHAWMCRYMSWLQSGKILVSNKSEQTLCPSFIIANNSDFSHRSFPSQWYTNIKKWMLLNTLKCIFEKTSFNYLPFGYVLAFWVSTVCLVFFFKQHLNTCIDADMLFLLMFTLMQECFKFQNEIQAPLISMGDSHWL